MNLNHHIKDEQILGFIYRTLSDADRETINRHLANCQVCRTRVSQYEVQQRQISNGLKTEINRASLPSGLAFSVIAPQLDGRRKLRFWSTLSSATPLVMAVTGLFLAAFGLWQTLDGWTSITRIPTPTGTFSVLACFTFMFVSMDQFDRSFSIKPRFILTVLLVLILWFGSFIIGLLNIIVITDLVIAGFLAIGGSPEGASVVAIIAVILAAMVYIGIIIGGAEYHYKNIGQPGSWKLFSWTLILQLLIMVLPYFLL
jgi:hypothetical protein